MKKKIFHLALCLFGLLLGHQSLAIEESTFKFTTDLTWASKYMINGINIGGDNPVFQFAAKTDHLKSGLSLMFWTAMQADRMNKKYDEQDLMLLYSRDFLIDSPYALNLHGFYDYWIYPNSEPATDDFGTVISTQKEQGNKFQIGLSMPKAIPLFQSYLVPSYNIYQLLYWAQNRSDLNRSGRYHELMLDYSQPIPVFIPYATYQYAGMSASTNYYDGAFDVKPGWSHSTAALQAGVYALKSIFTMGLNYQWTHEKTLNPGDEFWTTFSFVRKF